MDVVCSGPLVLQDVQADSSGEVNIGVVDGGLEEDSRSRVRIVVRESEGEFEGKTSIGSFSRAFYSRSPRLEIAIGRRESRDARSRRGHKLHQLGLQSALKLALPPYI